MSSALPVCKVGRAAYCGSSVRPLPRCELGDFVLDALLVVADHGDELVRTSWANQAIGVLIGRGYAPGHAARQIDLLPTRTEQDRRRSGHHLCAGLRAPDP